MGLTGKCGLQLSSLASELGICSDFCQLTPSLSMNDSAEKGIRPYAKV